MFNKQYNLFESTIDFPKDTLCPEIWEEVVDIKTGQNVLRMIPDVKTKIMNFVNVLLDAAKLPFPNSIHITGSITSNQYTENADIDIHFVGFEVDGSQEEIQRLLTEVLKTLRETDKDSTYVGTHPFEVYYQTNEFQDYMSIGCYDLMKDKWLVGPELSDPSFNPYSEYFAEIKRTAESKNRHVRDTILAVYEQAILCQKMSKDPESEIFIQAKQKLRDLLIQADSVYQMLRNSRKRMSDPQSVEQALEFRNDRKWKIADATFKLLDKFGYLAILKQYIELKKLLDAMSNSNEENEIFDEITASIISTVKDQLGNDEKLADSEHEQLDEGLNTLLPISIIAAALAIPHVLPEKSLFNELMNLPKKMLNISTDGFKAAVKNASTSKKSINGMSEANVINAVARTIYAEAKGEGIKGMKAVASVIWNRAGGKNTNFIPVISRRLQFSCWNDYSGGWVDKTYSMKVPKEALRPGKNKDIWDVCVRLATMMVNEKFTSSIGNRNSYMNKSTADKKNVDSWGKLLDLKINNHHFGYQKHYDGFKTPAQRIHVVKAGENLGKIAKQYKTTVDSIASKNNIKDVNTIQVGQKLKI